MRAVSRAVLRMPLVVLAPAPPVAAETTIFLMGYAVSVASPLVLLVSGVAQLGVALAAGVEAEVRSRQKPKPADAPMRIPSEDDEHRERRLLTQFHAEEGARCDSQR